MGIALEIKDSGESGLGAGDRLIKALKDEEDRGMSVTKAWTEMWQENLRYFFSEQLTGRKRHKDWDWIVVNYIWPSCMQEAAKLSRQEPLFVCDPWEDGDAEAAEAWQGWLQWTWDRGLNSEGMALEQLKAILCGKIYGYRVYKVYWEEEADWDDKVFPPKFVGDVKGKLWRPSLFWATGEENINDGSCGTVRYVDLEYALARWPDHGQSLRDEAERATAEMEEGGGPQIVGQSGGASLASPGTGGSDKGPDYGSNKLLDVVLDAIGSGHRQSDQKDKTKYVRISERWGKDYTKIDKQFSEPMPIQELLAQRRVVQRPDDPQFYDAVTGAPLDSGNWPQREPVQWKEPKFPRGRYILRAGDTVLNDDEADQKYPYRLWPFVTSPHYIIPFLWQGSDAVQLVKTEQDMINVSISHLVNHMKQFGDPKVAVERGAIDSPKGRDKAHFKIFSGAGSILRLARGGLSRFKILDPPQASPVIGMLYQIASQEYKNNIGLQDIAQGKKSPGDLTATESSMLAMSSADRIALQMVLERSWIERIGTLAAEICQKNYEPDRLVRILGENAVPGIVQITQDMKDVKYDIHVQVGSALPFDAEKRIARYLQANGLLMQPPSPMLPELLRVLEIPNWRKILQRHALWVEWMAFQQMLEGVRAGKIPPEQAMQMITQKAMQILVPLAQQQGQQEAAGGPPGQKREAPQPAQPQLPGQG